jgi:hypothetical protein
MSDVVPFLAVAPRVYASLQEFAAAFEQRRGVARKRFASQEKQLHGRLDMELTAKIDQLYRDSLGPWESRDADWWHNMDYYGDGVRALRFVLRRFPVDSMAIVRDFLSGAHSGFSMLIWFWEKRIEDGSPPIGGLWIDSRETLATASLIGPLRLAT